MRKLNAITTKGAGHRLNVGAMLVAFMFGVAGPAAAGNVLFSYKSSDCTNNVPPPDCGVRGVSIYPTVGGPTLVTTPTTNGGADFTVPSKIFSVMYSFAFTAPPTFPNVSVTVTRYNKSGTLMAGNWTPNAIMTFTDPDTQYPFVTATPPTGFVRANVGPQGLAGPLPRRLFSFYDFTLVNPGVGVTLAEAIVSGTTGGPLSNNRGQLGYFFGTNQTNMTEMGTIGFMEPNIWAFTGTVTVSQPGPFYDQYIVLTGMDDRTAGGAGKIQVVSGALVHSYNMTPLPPPQDETGTPTDYLSGTGFAHKTEFEFLPVPEPGQIALLGMGVLGLASIGMKMRRR